METNSNKQEKITAVANILAKIDPENLISFGAPVNEYDGEAYEIYKKINNKKLSEEQILEFLCNEFFEAFNTGTDEDNNRWEAENKEEVKEYYRNNEKFKTMARELKKLDL